MPAGAPSMRASTRWMMLSARSCSPAEMKILVPCDLVAAVGLLDRLGAQQAEIRAALRLGQVHGAGPFARHHLRHEHLLLFRLAVHHQRCGGAHGQAAIHRKRHVGRALEFGDDLAQRHRQPLPAIFRRRRQPEPAAFGHLLEGFLETLRGGDAAVVVAGTAFEIAATIERLQHLFAQLGRLADDGFAHVGGGIGKTGQVVVAIDLEHVVEQEGDVFHGGFVGRHGVLPAGATEISKRESCGVLGQTLSGSSGPRQQITGQITGPDDTTGCHCFAVCLTVCLAASFAISLASCSPIRRCSRFIPLSGRTITLK